MSGERRRRRRQGGAGRPSVVRSAPRPAPQRVIQTMASGLPSIGDRRPGPRRPASTPIAMLVVAAALVLVIAMLIASLFVGPDDAKAPGDRSITRPETGVAPSLYSDAPSTEVFAAIESRSTDPRPLTAEEVFSAKARFLVDGSAHPRLKLRASALDADCAAAVWGSGFADQLRRAGCRQVARGMYTDDKSNYAAMIAIFNLDGSSQANTIVAGAAPETGWGFVLPITHPAPPDRFGKGFSMGRGLAMGHYAVVTWVQRLDGGGDEQDERLLSMLVTAGKPPAILTRAARGTPG